MSIVKTFARAALIDVKLTPDEVIRTYGDDVWRFVSSKLSRREDVEDVVMEVFGIAFRNIHSLQKAESPKLWLLVVARRKAMDCLRRSYRRPELPLDAASDLPSPSSETMREQVRSMVERLPEMHRDVLILKYVNGFETAEVAKIVKKSEKATNSMLQRARQSLRELGIAELPWLAEAGVSR
jgi:RNA polymerase sigma-70 factor (ECF subfamily)